MGTNQARIVVKDRVRDERQKKLAKNEPQQLATLLDIPIVTGYLDLKDEYSFFHQEVPLEALDECSFFEDELGTML